MAMNSKSFLPGNKRGLGRPIGSGRMSLVLPYLDRLYKEISVEEFAALAREAYRLAMSPINEKVSARDKYNFMVWLGRTMMPLEPAMFMQIFAPNVSIEDHRKKISELKILINQYKELREESSSITDGSEGEAKEIA